MFTPVPLNWNENALEPHISARTVELHYHKHYKGYLDKVNALIGQSEADYTTILDLVKKSSGSLFNSAAQAWNHEFYWQSLSPISHKPPSNHVIQKVKNDFDGIENFKLLFTQKAINHFGSGWIWLVYNGRTSKLEIHDTHDAENLIKHIHLAPLVNLDVWEHAYYVDYQNDRTKFANVSFELINWGFAESNYIEAVERFG